MSKNLPAQPRPAPKAPINTGREVVALVPQDVESAFRVASALANAGDMIPKQFQERPDAIMAAMMRGAEVGLAPMQALSCIAVIGGRATIWGDALPALMQRAGHHVDVVIEGEGERAVAIATLERGDTGKTIVRRFSMADAKRAGLLGKPGPWTQYPLRMLSHRARAWAIRDGASDALMGMQIRDEVDDYGPDSARDVTPRRRSASTFTPAAHAEIEAGEPQIDDILDGHAGPTDDEMARAEAEALDAIRRRDRELEALDDPAHTEGQR